MLKAGAPEMNIASGPVVAVGEVLLPPHATAIKPSVIPARPHKILFILELPQSV